MTEACGSSSECAGSTSSSPSSEQDLSGGQGARIKTLCKLYLGPRWNGRPEKISVEKLNKGCSNDILAAFVTDDKDNVIDKVLVRIYGENISRPSKLTQDVFLTTYLAQLGKIPKVRGFFQGGRFEEFLQCSNIERQRFRQQYKRMIGLVAALHNLQDMPLPKDVFLQKELRYMVVKLSDCDKTIWEPEVDWYLGTLSKIGEGMRLGLCHNDLNQNNIIIPDAEPDKFILIDYEYTGYNYTLFDIANYCAELQYDWSHPSPPFFLFNENWLPSDAGILDMIRHYKTLVEPEILTPDEVMLQQVKFLIVGSELLWATWARSLGQGFNVDMDQYKAVKTESYFKKKKELLVVSTSLPAAAPESQGEHSA